MTAAAGSLDWRKEKDFGSGSFGAIELWSNVYSNETLVLKFPKIELSPKQQERWKEEAKAFISFNSTNLVQAKQIPHDLNEFIKGNNPNVDCILSMEYCSGGNLRQKLNKIESYCGLQECDVRDILKDIKNAIEYLHKNEITHRDIKPDNIVLQTISSSRDGPAIVYKLVDLGFAKEINGNSGCVSIYGTSQYLSPEILNGKNYTTSADFWSLGLLAFEITTGVFPFLANKTPAQWMPYVMKKSSDDIFIYETFHGDIEYSAKILTENHLSEAFKAGLEKWLRLALEVDPKKRGYNFDTKIVTFNLPEGNYPTEKEMALFDQLDNLLEKKSIMIFSLYTYSFLTYEMTGKTSIKSLKDILAKETKIPFDSIILISSENVLMKDDEHIFTYSKHLIFLHHKEIFLKNENLKPKVPILIQRCLEHPKTLYNHKNSKELQRACYHFVSQEFKLYNYFLRGCLTRAETLKKEGDKILVKQNLVNQDVSNIDVMQKMFTKLVEFSEEQLTEKANQIPLWSTENLASLISKATGLFESVNNLRKAWMSLSTRIQSSTKRINAVTMTQLTTHGASKQNYSKIMQDLNILMIKNKKKVKDIPNTEKQCLDIVWICQQCLKIRECFFLDIKMHPSLQTILDVTLEHAKIVIAMKTTTENLSKLTVDIDQVHKLIIKEIWGLIGQNNDYADLPYSLISFERNNKVNFKIGDEVSMPLTNGKGIRDAPQKDIDSLVIESYKMRKAFKMLKNKVDAENVPLM